jgi:hypothetical protein
VAYACDLNLTPYLETCRPSFSVSRIDSGGMICVTAMSGLSAPLASRARLLCKGYNYRYTELSVNDEGYDSRDLYKVWGIRLVVYVSGRQHR